MPSSFTQISWRNRVVTGRPQAGGDQRLRDRARAIGPRAVRLAEADAIAFGVPNDARLDDLGREIGQRPDDAPWLDRRRDDAARIDALEAQPFQLAADALKIPPRDAVLRADDDGVRTEAAAAAAARAP